MPISTKTEVSNLALSELGARKLTDFDADTSEEALSCRRWFEVVTNDLLRRHHWNFAVRDVPIGTRAKPWVEDGEVYSTGDMVTYAGSAYVCGVSHTSSSADTPGTSGKWAHFSATPWSFASDQPADCVRLIGLAGYDVFDTPPFRVTNLPTFDVTAIWHNLSDDPTLIYVTNDVPIANWDSLFMEAVVLHLASKIANDVTQRQDAAAGITQRLQALVLPDAKLADTREVRSGENFGVRALISQSGLVQARFRQDGRPPVT